MDSNRKRGKPAKKYSQASRVHDLIRLIEARHGVTIEEMAEETGVNRRTIHRDLMVIHESGYPLIADWHEGKKLYRFITRFKDIPPVAFSLQELVTLSFFSCQSTFLSGTPFQEDMDSIFRKVKAALPPRLSAHMERITTMATPLLQGVRDYSDVKEHLRLLRESLLFQYRVTITYDPKGKGEPALYEVDPYSLIFYKGGLYLIGYAHNRKGLRTFAIERITGVDTSKTRFDIPADFKVEDQLKSAFGIVEEKVLELSVRFSATVAHAVKDRQWHPTQRMQTNPDGSITVSFKAGGKLEIVSWILSYGEHAEVLAPESLRQEMVRIVNSLAARYGLPKNDEKGMIPE